MIDGEYFAGRTVFHAINEMNVSDKIVRRNSPNKVVFYGIDYVFNVSGDELDILVEHVDSKEQKSFNDYLERTQEKNFWDKDFLIHIKQKRNEFKGYIANLRLEKNGNGHYHFKAKLKTKSEDKAFFAVFNNIIRVANLYNDPRIRESKQ